MLMLLPSDTLRSRGLSACTRKMLHDVCVVRVHVCVVIIGLDTKRILMKPTRTMMAF